MLKFGQRSASFYRVLVAEDSEILHDFYADALRIFGFHKVTIVENGQQAIDKVRQTQESYLYDFIILDWEMPEVSGIEFLKYIRTSPESPDFFMPVLFSTGKAEKRHVIEARDAGTTEFIAKPFAMEQFKNKIVSLLSREREFIITDQYIGPTRRHKQIPLPEGQQDRRKAA